MNTYVLDSAVQQAGERLANLVSTRGRLVTR
jgi:hypothetical protein